MVTGDVDLMPGLAEERGVGVRIGGCNNPDERLGRIGLGDQTARRRCEVRRLVDVGRRNCDPGAGEGEAGRVGHPNVD